MDTTKQIISAQIQREQREALQRLAERGDRSLSAEVRRAIVHHLERSQGVSSGESPRASTSSVAPVGGVLR